MKLPLLSGVAVWFLASTAYLIPIPRHWQEQSVVLSEPEKVTGWSQALASV